MLRSFLLSIACIGMLSGCLHHRGWRQSATAYEVATPYAYAPVPVAQPVVLAWRPVPVTTWVPVSTYAWVPYYAPVAAGPTQ